jgi:hypothetical protein
LLGQHRAAAVVAFHFESRVLSGLEDPADAKDGHADGREHQDRAHDDQRDTCAGEPILNQESGGKKKTVSNLVHTTFNGTRVQRVRNEWGSKRKKNKKKTKMERLAETYAVLVERILSVCQIRELDAGIPIGTKGHVDLLRGGSEPEETE